MGAAAWGLGSAAGAGEASYRWPLELTPELTSTFCEFREGHFHAGIDLSTFGETGAKVFAVADGTVVRVRAGARGYGRAIYLELEDGRLAVYAHLSTYYRALAEYVRDEQEKAQSYRVDLYPEPGRFRVRQGDVIALSGDSGAGAAHLHFELREGDVAVNPLTHGLTTADRHAPTLRALVWTPMDPDARVGGRLAKERRPLQLETDEGGVRLYRTPDPVAVWGQLRVGVDGYDRAGKRASRMGIYRLELWVDGALQVTTQFDRFSYHHNHEVLALYDLEEAVNRRRHVVNLFAQPGIAGDFHAGAAADAGILDAGGALEPGPHVVVVRAFDAHGNRSEAVAQVTVFEPPRAARIDLVPAGERRAALEFDGVEGRGRLRVWLERALGTGAFEALGMMPLSSGRVYVELPPVAADGAPVAATWRARVVDEAGARSAPLVAGWHPDGDASAKGGASAVEADPAAAPRLDARLVARARLCVVEIEAEAPWAATPRLTLSGTPLGGVETVGPATVRAFVHGSQAGPLQVSGRLVDGRPVDGQLVLDWQAVRRAAASRFVSADGGAAVEFPKAAFFEDAYVAAVATAQAPPASLPAGLALISPVYQLEPKDLPLDGRARVALRLPAGEKADGVLLYRDTGRGHAFEGGDWQEQWVSGRVRRLGRFFLARDTAPPELQVLVPAPGAHLDARPALVARVDDQGSGLVEAAVVVALDGRDLPTEWDPDAKRMRVTPRQPLAPGRHRASFRATDRAGLTTTQTVEFQVP